MSSVFWVAVSTMAAILFVSTVFGRAVSRTIPGRLGPAATFYLSPAFGLSLLIIFVSLAGRHVPIGSVPIRLVLASTLILFFFLEPDRINSLKHALTVMSFGIICSSPILGGLFAHGAYDSHNDAFTYLAHSIWLQTHPFGSTIRANEMTPFTSQIGMYQKHGLRMGASYLIALVQASTGVRWPYAIYPSVVGSAVTACFLAAGFPLTRALHGMSRTAKLALLSLPAFSLNGVTFGAAFGFAPQTLGLAFASSLVFVIGYLMRWTAVQRRDALDVARAAMPGAILFAALTYAYSEMMPFVALAILMSALCVMFKRRGSTTSVVMLGASFAVVALILLNTEVARAAAAIRSQTNVVVGSPVNWSLSGFIGHALGVHGGAWDGFNWSIRGTPKTTAYFWGMGSVILIVATLLLARNAIWKRIADYSLLPATVILVIFGVAILGFRYGVRSPFPSGVGQSWSQFKLSEWASPFASTFVLLALTSFRKRLGNFLRIAGACSLAALITTEAIVWPSKLHGEYGVIVEYYGAPRSVGRYFSDLRQFVDTTCRPDEPVYLDLHGRDMKAREMLTMYLDGRQLKSDWRDDVYFEVYNSGGGKSESVAPSDCVIASKDDPKYSDVGVTSGPFRVIAPR